MQDNIILKRLQDVRHYFALTCLRIRYIISVFGNCAKEYVQKLQVIQNEQNESYHQTLTDEFLLMN